jgi:hypothetical protein
MPCRSSRESSSDPSKASFYLLPSAFYLLPSPRFSLLASDEDSANVIVANDEP